MPCLIFICLSAIMAGILARNVFGARSSANC